uniref:Uncharacterized protein n=1 Tax=Panagrolaimus sp. JU765 TaxID=591449 RepID=A0AC34RRT3_9BILA
MRIIGGRFFKQKSENVAVDETNPGTSKSAKKDKKHRQQLNFINQTLCPFSFTNSSDDENDETIPSTLIQQNHNIPSTTLTNFDSLITTVNEVLTNPELGTPSERAAIVVHSTVEYKNILVPNLSQITSSSYYWGMMDRYEAESLLDGKPEGTFLLRDSAQINYLFSVSFRRYSRTLHARIEFLNGKFSFDIHDEKAFKSSSISELIDHFKDPKQCWYYEPQLSLPLQRNFVFSLKHLSRATIVSNTTYNQVSSLPLPGYLKKYLREYHYKQPIRITELDV